MWKTWTHQTRMSNINQEAIKESHSQGEESIHGGMGRLCRCLRWWRQQWIILFCTHGINRRTIQEDGKVSTEIPKYEESLAYSFAIVTECITLRKQLTLLQEEDFSLQLKNMFSKQENDFSRSLEISVEKVFLTEILRLLVDEICQTMLNVDHPTKDLLKQQKTLAPCLWFIFSEVSSSNMGTQRFKFFMPLIYFLFLRRHLQMKDLLRNSLTH